MMLKLRPEVSSKDTLKRRKGQPAEGEVLFLWNEHTCILPMTHVQDEERLQIRRKDNPKENGLPTWAFYKGQYSTK